MKKIAALTLSLAVAVAVPVAIAAKPPKPPRNAKLTATFKPAAIVFGKFVTISGNLSSNTAGVPVELQADPIPYDGKWVTRGTKNTDAKGNVSFALAPDVSSKLRLQTSAAPRLTSSEATIAVAWRVGFRVSDSTPNKGQRVRFSGSVHPAHAGGTVLIQKRTASGFKTVKSTVLKAATATYSTYSTRLRIRTTGTYRVRVPADASHASGTSRTRTLTVG
jgi:hypothetical protein